MAMQSPSTTPEAPSARRQIANIKSSRTEIATSIAKALEQLPSDTTHLALVMPGPFVVGNEYSNAELEKAGVKSLFRKDGRQAVAGALVWEANVEARGGGDRQLTKPRAAFYGEKRSMWQHGGIGGNMAPLYVAVLDQGLGEALKYFQRPGGPGGWPGPKPARPDSIPYHDAGDRAMAMARERAEQGIPEEEAH